MTIRIAASWTFFLLCVSLFGIITAASAQQEELEFEIETNIQDTYRAGGAYEIDLSIRLVDPAGSVERGVLFLNVVENDASRNYPQAAHRIFESATETVEIFRIPFDGEALRAGLETTVQVQVRPDAPVGSYSIVFQLFEGEQTDPNRVQIENRVAIRSFPFELVR